MVRWISLTQRFAFWSVWMTVEAPAAALAWSHLQGARPLDVLVNHLTASTVLTVTPRGADFKLQSSLSYICRGIIYQSSPGVKRTYGRAGVLCLG